MIGPGPDRWDGREVGLRLGSGVVPAYVGGDRSVLLGVAAVVGAVGFVPDFTLRDTQMSIRGPATLVILQECRSAG
jgi:hypothetical protein